MVRANQNLVLSSYTRMRGITFTEVLVGLVISSILIAAGLAMFASTAKYSTDTMRTIKLHQELMLSLEMMASDIRRAGYWGSAVSTPGAMANSNPFMAAGADLSVSGTQDCILFSYDKNDDGSLPVINTGSDDERYGFRLKNGAVQVRATGATFDCASTSSDWQDVTDRSIINITGLSFVPQNSMVTSSKGAGGMSYIDVRSILITITGNHVDKPSESKTLSYHVRVRNDKYH